MDECISNPCQNGAVCSDSTDAPHIVLNRYSCACAAGFVSGVCAHTYELWLANYTNSTGLCSVLTGGNCDVDLDECVSSPCQNGGACTDSTDDAFVRPDAYHCECTDDWSTAAETDCMDCRVGKHFSSGLRRVGRCRDCQPGTFADVPGAVACTDCAAGKFVRDEGADSSSDCQNCMAGFFSRPGSAGCTRCAAGQYQGSEGMSSCITCGPGSVTNALADVGATTCTACDAGQFSTVSTEACEDCAVGQYTPWEGSARCIECEPGTWSASTVACATCSAGSVTDTLANSGGTSCKSGSPHSISQAVSRPFLLVFSPFFLRFFWPVFRKRPRKEWSPPTYSWWIGTACDAGRYSSVSTVACADCVAGLYQGLQGMASCDDCSPGSVTDTLAMGRATSCSKCAAGKSSQLSTAPCQQCIPGSFSLEESTVCTACGRPRCRFYPDEENPDLPYDCSEPQWVASQDQSTCVDCPAGREPSGDRSFCQPCLPGTASEDGIQCLMCNDTRVNRNQSSISNSAQTACVPCGPGEEANAPASECVDCSPGRFAPCTASGCGVCVSPLIVTPDRTGCVPAYRCPAAQSCVPPCLTSIDCEQCPVGSVSAGGEECEICADRGPGWVANKEQTACERCRPGEMPSADRSRCVSCLGDYISMLGSECQRCSTTQVANP